MHQHYLYVYYDESDKKQAEAILSSMQNQPLSIPYTGGSQFTEKECDSLSLCAAVVLFLSQKALQSQTIVQVMNQVTQCNKSLALVYLEEIPLSADQHHQLNQQNASVTYKGNANDTAQELVRRLFAMNSQSFHQSYFTQTAYSFNSDDSTQKACNTNEDFRLSKTMAPPPQAMPYVPCGQPPAAYYMPTQPSKNSPRRRAKKPSVTGPIHTLVLSPTRKKTIGERIKNLVMWHPMLDVNFSVLAPKIFFQGRYSLVDIYAYEDAFRHVVEHIKVRRAQAEGDISETDGGRLKARKGAIITIRLSSPDVIITDNEESRKWTGHYTKFDFPVLVPTDYQRDQIAFCATVYFDGVIATHIHFALDCNKKKPQQPPIEQHNIHSAFISYASGDRDRVSLILQGLRRSRPDLDVFFDIETLRSGTAWENVLRPAIDQRDILYLCWSPLAKQSPWVDMEWRYALKQKGLDGIEPIPLVLPEECAPPEELKSKHFGAVEAYYRDRKK